MTELKFPVESVHTLQRASILMEAALIGGNLDYFTTAINAMPAALKQIFEFSKQLIKENENGKEETNQHQSSEDGGPQGEKE